MAQIQTTRRFVAPLGLEEDPLHATLAAIGFGVFDQATSVALAARSNVDLVEHDIEPADLDRPPPCDDDIAVELAVDVEQPHDPDIVAGEQWCQSRLDDRPVEAMLVGRTVFGDELDETVGVVGRRPSHGRGHPAEPNLAPMDASHGHPLAAVLRDAVAGRFPAADGRVDVLPPDAAGTQAVVAFTGHACLLTDRPPDDPAFEGVDGFGGATDARLLVELAGAGWIGSLDQVLARPVAVAAATPVLPEIASDDQHPRVTRARRHRRDVRVLGDERGLVTIGRGLVDRIEISVELTGAPGGSGAGRALLMGALAHLDAGDVVFAQVAPGNAASVRMFLACGFVPLGSEVLFEPA